MSALYRIACKFIDADLSCFPVRPDGSKRPAIEWKEFQKRPATKAEWKEWSNNGFARSDIGLVCGKVSGGLEVLDFDEPSLYPEWAKLVEAASPGLLKRLPVLKTPSGGKHVEYRCKEIEGNQKLAERAKSDPLYSKKRTLIETRGEGGYVARGKRYKHVAGPPIENVPTITADERQVLLNAARSFNRNVVEFTSPRSSLTKAGKDRPGDRFDGNADWREILEPHGWTATPGANGVTYWRRPGKKESWSATTGYCKNSDGIDLLYVFSSNADPFENEKAYTPFQAYTFLEHDGTFSKAAKALAKEQSKSKANGQSTESHFHGGTLKPLSVAGFKRIVQKWLPGTDELAIDVVYGSIAGRELPGDPLWTFLVAPPSSGKTELLNPLDGHDAVMFLSNLTRSSLVSGYRADGSDDDPSLLPKLNGKTLIIKDFTPILSMHPESQAAIFGQLRDVYEGKADYHFGNVAGQSYRSKFNIIAAVTDAIESHARAMQPLGERFLYYKPTQGNRREKTLRALENANREPEMRRKLGRAAARLLAGVSKKIPSIPEALKVRIVELADLLAVGRTFATRNREKEHTTIPSPESPTRVVKQLFRLGQGIAMLHGRDTLTDYEFRVIQRVVMNSLPRYRSLILRALADGLTTVDELHEQTNIPKTNVRYTLEDKQLLGVVVKEKKSERMKTKDGRKRVAVNHWKVHADFKSVLPPSDKV